MYSVENNKTVSKVDPSACNSPAQLDEESAPKVDKTPHLPPVQQKAPGLRGSMGIIEVWDNSNNGVVQSSGGLTSDDGPSPKEGRVREKSYKKIDIQESKKLMKPKMTQGQLPIVSPV
mmetsp:Transcript_1932/g.2775  ORF Transcript_1932/g.2775 Transcript_1932/m.2775 type:complete len:118 (-) Transcript_1932:396-749(-)